jgi:uncharacterized membrane protein YbhN (UPF0104 family)
LRRLLPAAVSAAILAAIYWRLDWAEFARVTSGARWGWLAAALALVVPTTLASAWRFCLLAPGRAIRFGESLKLTLAASVLNLALPSKMGDLAKAWFMARRGHMAAGAAFGLVLFEKAADLLALLALCLVGLFAAGGAAPGGLGWAVAAALGAGVAAAVSQRLSRAALEVAPARLRGVIEAWRSVQVSLAGERALALSVAALSLGAWLVHLAQIWMFARALNAAPPFVAAMALAALAILAGLVPVTLAGIGTRDAALIYLFRHYLAPEGGAALGLLCTLRYLMPAIAGLPYLGQMAAPAQWASLREGSTPSRPATRS